MKHVKVGDTVTRWLTGVIPIRLKVTAITEGLIVCGPWEFDRATGAEVDEKLGWGPSPLPTGSYIEAGTLRGASHPSPQCTT